jgi:hypothetical protein
VMRAGIGVSRGPTGVTPAAMGALQVGTGVMRETTVVMYATTFVTPAGSEGSCDTRPATQIPAVVIAVRWGALHGLPAVSSGSRRGVRADLAVGRGPLALSAGLNAEAPFLSQLLENPVEGAAVRLVTDRFATSRRVSLSGRRGKAARSCSSSRCLCCSS